MGRMTLLDRRHGWLRRDASYDAIGRMVDLLEEYDQALRQVEDEAIARINRNLEAAFVRIAEKLGKVYRRELAYQERGEYVNERSPERPAALLQQLQPLLTRLNPIRQPIYQRILQDLLQQANALGLEYGERLVATQYQGDEFIPRTVNIPIKAVAEAANSARQYLDWSRDYGRESGTSLANRISDIVQRGLIAGDGAAVIARDLKSLGGVVKNRAEMIARTESLKASNAAQMKVYEANGIRYGVWFATADERTCPYCAPLMGNIYRLTDLYVNDSRGWTFQIPPAHVRCRCKVSGVTLMSLAINPDELDDFQKLHSDTMQRQVVPPATGPPHFIKAAGRQMPRPVWEAATGRWLDPVASARFQQFSEDNEEENDG